MRIWLVFVAVGMLVLLGCGSSQDTVAPAPAPAPPSMSAGEAVGLVQSELRKTCSPTSPYMRRADSLMVQLSAEGYFVGWSVQDASRPYGRWLVHPSGVVQTMNYLAENCQ